MKTNNITIEYLADVPEVIPVISKWLYDEFNYLIPGKTLEYVIESLQARLNHDIIPLSIVAFENNEILGTVSLKISDMDIRNNLQPWLAGLFVNVKYRNNGVGSFLVKSIEKIAKQLGENELYLYTPNASDFYNRIGWLNFEELEYKSNKVVIMKRFL